MYELIVRLVEKEEPVPNPVLHVQLSNGQWMKEKDPENSSSFRYRRGSGAP